MYGDGGGGGEVGGEGGSGGVKIEFWLRVMNERPGGAWARRGGGVMPLGMYQSYRN